QSRSRCQHPQVLAGREGRRGQEAEARFVDVDAVAFAQVLERAGELAARHDDGKKLEEVVVRRRYDGIGPPDDAPPGSVLGVRVLPFYAQAGELPRRETKAW